MACDVTLSAGEKKKHTENQTEGNKEDVEVVRSFVEAVDKGAASVNRLATRPCLNEEGLKMSLSRYFPSRSSNRQVRSASENTQSTTACVSGIRSIQVGWIGGWMGGSCAAYRLAAARLFSSFLSSSSAFDFDSV